FDVYKNCQGLDGCYVECMIENGDDVLAFRNRIGQKVSLDSLAPFDEYKPDGTTLWPLLTYYPGLDQTIELNPMMIRMMNIATVLTSGTGSNQYTNPQLSD